VGPFEPGYYNYGFAIDGGIRSPDPANPNLEARAGGIQLLRVFGDKPLIQEVHAVPHGTLHINMYESKSLGMTRNVYVYTPPGYEQSAAKVSGAVSSACSGLIEEAWIRVARQRHLDICSPRAR